MLRTPLIVFLICIHLFVCVRPCLVDEPKPLEIPIIKTSIEPSRSITPQVIEKRNQTKEEIINGYIKEICLSYNMEPEFVQALVYQESRYDIKAKNQGCVGLMQINTYYHADRAKRLGVTDFYDPYGNILLGVDYLSELFHRYKDPRMVLRVYKGVK